MTERANLLRRTDQFLREVRHLQRLQPGPLLDIRIARMAARGILVVEIRQAIFLQPRRELVVVQIYGSGYATPFLMF
jgi:hypothetical protein